MKVVVSCDAIVDRDYYLEIVEAVLDVLGDQTELYTLVHNQGRVVGPIEQRKIHSSFLTNTTKTWNELLENNYLVPSACKNLYISCENDLVINISRGFSHGLKKCEKSKQITFVVDDINAKPRKRTIKEKVFGMFVRNFQKKLLTQADELWVSTLDIIPRSYRSKARVVHPPVRLTDYKILPESMQSLDYILINAESLDIEKARSIRDNFINAKIKFKFVGKDDHLKDLKDENPQYFFGSRCGGEMGSLLAGCLYLIDFDSDVLPIWALRTMATGRPVFSFGNKFMDFKEGFFHAPDEVLTRISPTPHFDKSDVRGAALEFEQLRFKSFLKKRLKDLTI